MRKRIRCILITLSIVTLTIVGCKRNNIVPKDNINEPIAENNSTNQWKDAEKVEEKESSNVGHTSNNDSQNNVNNESKNDENNNNTSNESKHTDKKENTASSKGETIDKKQDKAEQDSIDNATFEWWFIRNKEHKTPRINGNIKYNLKDYEAYYVGDTEKKVLYLTFDEGYENGYTPKILDILKKNEVKATFFVTLPYLEERPDLVKRMEEDGHVVGNHTKSHFSMPDITANTDKFQNELTSVEKKYNEITGKEMAKYFRPPMGAYSQKSLSMAKDMGYKTIFWSFAYKDYEPTEQPDPKEAKNMILEGLHNGAILLLHAISKTNTEILEDIIVEAKNQGYEFELLP